MESAQHLPFLICLNKMIRIKLSNSNHYKTMEKNGKMIDTGGLHPVLIKLIRTMKISLFLLLFTVTQVFAVSTYSQVTRITIDMQNASVKDVLYEIEENSEFYFIYSNKLVDVDRKVNIKLTNKKVEDILDEIFDGGHIKGISKNPILI